MQMEASQHKISELEEQIRQQPMTAKDAQDLHQNIEDAENRLNQHRARREENERNISELQMQHNRWEVLDNNYTAMLHVDYCTHLR